MTNKMIHGIRCNALEISIKYIEFKNRITLIMKCIAGQYILFARRAVYE